MMLEARRIAARGLRFMSGASQAMWHPPPSLPLANPCHSAGSNKAPRIFNKLNAAADTDREIEGEGERGTEKDVEIIQQNQLHFVASVFVGCPL